MLRLAVVDVMVAAPAVAPTAADVVTVELAVKEAVVAADTIADMLTVEPVEVTLTLPAVEVKVAVALVMAPEPEIVMFPDARIAPVGATEVPPVMDTTPFEAVKEAEPEYPALGDIRMLAPVNAPEPASIDEARLVITRSAAAARVVVVLLIDPLVRSSMFPEEV